MPGLSPLVRLALGSVLLAGCSAAQQPAVAPATAQPEAGRAAAGVVAQAEPAAAASPTGGTRAAAGRSAVVGGSAPPPDAGLADLDAGMPVDAGPARPPASYLLGADITWVQADEARGATYSDGTRRDILSLLAAHGFNAIRLRTFVDPRAADGYDQKEGFGDLAHTIAFARRIRAAGMSFLLDFHYSDNWADPAKQCVPVAWQDLRGIL